MVRRPDLFARFDETQLTTKAQRRILQQAKDELTAGDGAGDGEAPSAPEK
jgi:tRNA (guanine37-N1)-methyltransferase